MEGLFEGKNTRLVLSSSMDPIRLSKYFESESKIAKNNVYILTRGTIIIDKTIVDTGGNICNLLMCANNIEVKPIVGQYIQIGLKGRNGNKLPKAENGENYGDHGKDGKNGENGGPAGNIYVISNQELNVPNLTLASNGGDAGNGQEGGNGFSGLDDGEYAKWFYGQIATCFKNFQNGINKLCEFLKFEAPKWTVPDFIENYADETKLLKLPSAKVYEEIKRRAAILALISAIIYAAKDKTLKTCVCFGIQYVYEKITEIKEISDIFSKSGTKSSPECKPDDCKVVRLMNEKELTFSNLVKMLNEFEDKFWIHGHTNFETLMKYSGGVSSKSDLGIMQATCNRLLFLLMNFKVNVSNDPLSSLEKMEDKVWTNLVENIQAVQQDGGRGGNGGTGGLPGCPGKIIIYPPVETGKNLKIVRRSGSPGIPGMGGRGGAHGQTKQTGEVQYAENGDNGEEGTMRHEHDDTDLRDWDPYERCNISEFTEMLDLSQRDLFISILTSHQWTLKNVLNPEFFLDQCLQLSNTLSIQSSQETTPFTPTRLENLLKFQQHLITFTLANSEKVGEDSVFRFLVDSSYCRTRSLQLHLQYPPLVTNLGLTLTSAVDDVTAIKESKMDYIFTQYFSGYMNSLDIKIEEARNQTQQEISSCLKDIDANLSDLLQNYKGDLEKAIKIMKQQSPFQRAQSVIKFIDKLSGFAAFIDPIAGTALKSATNALDATVDKLSPNVEPPAAVKKGNKLIDLQKISKQKLQAVTNQIQILSNFIEKECLPNNLKTELCFSLDELKKCKTLLENCRQKKEIDIPKFELVEHLLDETRDNICDLVNDEKKNLNNTKLTLTLDDLILCFRTTDSGNAELHSTGDSWFMKQKKKIAGDSEAVSLAKQREDKAKKHLKPLIDSLKAILYSQIGGKAEAAFPRWKLEDMISHTKDFIEKFFEGFTSENELKIVFEKIQRVMDMHFNLWKTIQEYEETKEMETWKAKMTGVFDKLGNIENNVSKLEEKAFQVNFYIQAEMLLLEYEIVKKAFLQWAFPYAQIFLQEVFHQMKNLMEIYAGAMNCMNGSVTSTLEDKKDKITRAVECCTEIISHFAKVHEGTSGKTTKLEEKMMKNFFYESPLFVWKNAEWGLQIRKFLEGELIQLDAPITQTVGEKFAIKVNGSIDLKISCSEPEANENLKTELKPFLLEMTHSGTSVYRVGNDYYAIQNCDPIQLKSNLSFKSKDENFIKFVEDKTTLNQRKEKMEEFVLSPITKWSFQLSSEQLNQHDCNTKFADLAKKFADKIDLELVGWGLYLDKIDESECNNLESYYDKVEETSELYKSLCAS